jgi:hypothetical protein
MSDMLEHQTDKPAKLLVNLGSGPKGNTWIPTMFADWRELRVDVDAQVAPDILADITDLSAIESSSVDAVWAAHCVEHLYIHQVAGAVAEAHRILTDVGFLVVIVPDLQAIAEFLSGDRLHEMVYESQAGPVTAHDIVFGYAPSLAQGHFSMAHNCGFTPTLLLHQLQKTPFAEIVLRRRANHELAAIARKRAPADDVERQAFLAALQL